MAGERQHREPLERRSCGSWAAPPTDVFAAIINRMGCADQGAMRLTCRAWRDLAAATLSHATLRIPQAPIISPPHSLRTTPAPEDDRPFSQPPHGLRAFDSSATIHPRNTLIITNCASAYDEPRSAAEGDRDDEQVGPGAEDEEPPADAPASIPRVSFLGALPQFQTLHDMCLMLPPLPCCHMPVAAVLPPGLRKLAILCASNLQAKSATAAQYCPAPAPHGQQPTVHLAALCGHTALRSLTLLGVSVAAPDLLSLNLLHLLKLFHCTVTHPSGTTSAAACPPPSGTPFLHHDLTSGNVPTAPAFGHRISWSSTDSTSLPPVPASTDGAALNPTTSLGVSGLRTVSSRDMLPFTPRRTGSQDALNRTPSHPHPRSPQLQPYVFATGPSGGAELARAPPPRGPRRLSVSNCRGLSATAAVRLFHLGPMQGLAIADEVEDICGILGGDLQGLSSLRLDQIAAVGESSSERDAAPPLHFHGVLNKLSSLITLRELRLRLSGDLIAASPGALAALSALSQLSSLTIGQLLNARDAVFRTTEATICNEDMGMLRGMPLLEQLRLSGAGMHVGHASATPACEPPLAGGLAALAFVPRLHSLALDCCHTLADAEAFVLSSAAAPTLLSLDLSFCQRISLLGLRVLAARLSRMRALRLDGCYIHVSDAVLLELARLPQLEELSVAFCERLTTGGVAAALPWLRRLRHLDVSRCESVDIPQLAAAFASPAAPRRPRVAVDERFVKVVAGGVSADIAVWTAAPGLLPPGHGVQLRSVVRQCRPGQEVAGTAVLAHTGLSMQHDHCCQGGLCMHIHGPEA